MLQCQRESICIPNGDARSSAIMIGYHLSTIQVATKFCNITNCNLLHCAIRNARTPSAIINMSHDRLLMTTIHYLITNAHLAYLFV